MPEELQNEENTSEGMPDGEQSGNGSDQSEGADSAVSGVSAETESGGEVEENPEASEEQGTDPAAQEDEEENTEASENPEKGAEEENTDASEKGSAEQNSDQETGDSGSEKEENMEEPAADQEGTEADPAMSETLLEILEELREVRITISGNSSDMEDGTIEEDKPEISGVANGLAVSNFSIGVLIGVLLIRMIFLGVVSDDRSQ